MLLHGLDEESAARIEELSLILWRHWLGIHGGRFDRARYVA